LNTFYSCGDRQAKGHEYYCCRKRAVVEELSLRQISDEVCRAVDAGGNDVAFAERRRTAMPSLPIK